jgi:hypothetical protein
MACAGKDYFLVAGEAEKVPSVMQELVDIHPADQRRRAFLSADKIDRDHENKAGKNGPWKYFANGNRNGLGRWCKGHGGHRETPEFLGLFELALLRRRPQLQFLHAGIRISPIPTQSYRCTI